MLMRVQDTVDYNHVKPEHEAVHERLSNWARWAADTRRKLLALGLWPKGVPVPDD